jgi:hypothetical protein
MSGMRVEENPYVNSHVTTPVTSAANINRMIPITTANTRRHRTGNISFVSKLDRPATSNNLASRGTNMGITGAATADVAERS